MRKVSRKSRIGSAGSQEIWGGIDTLCNIHRINVSPVKYKYKLCPLLSFSFLSFTFRCLAN